MSDAADALGADPARAIPAVPTDEVDPAPSPADRPWLTPDGRLATAWLAVHGLGVGLDDAAEEIAETALGRGVRVVIGTTDDYPRVHTPLGYKGLVLILHSAPSGQGQESTRWSKFRQLVEDFRSHTVPAAQAFAPGSPLSHRAGVLQVLYTDEVLDNEHARDLIDLACAAHPFIPGSPFTGDLFAIYQQGAHARRSRDQVALARRKHWRRLTSWGITSLDQAEVIKAEIEAERERLNNPEKRVLHRPLPGQYDLNQLELVLFKPEAKPVHDPDAADEDNLKAQRTFKTNGARAVRVLVDRLIEQYEWFHRPPAHDGKRDAQPLFHNLYQALRIILGG